MSARVVFEDAHALYGALASKLDDNAASELEEAADAIGYLWRCWGRDGESICWANVDDWDGCENCGTPYAVGHLQAHER